MWKIYIVYLLSASRLNYQFEVSKGVMTGGLVREYSHIVLPNITPLISLILTSTATIPCLVKLWKLKSVFDFVRCIVICSLTAIIFGYHVHEKAILMAVIPLA